jgi:hypothetical protein
MTQMLPIEIIRKIILLREPTDVTKELNLLFRYHRALNATLEDETNPWLLIDVCYIGEIDVLQSLLPEDYVV